MVRAIEWALIKVYCKKNLLDNSFGLQGNIGRGVCEQISILYQISVAQSLSS